MPPSRIFYWIESQDPAKAVAFAKPAYRKYWLEGHATSDREVAADAAASIGLDRGAVMVGIQHPDTKDQLMCANEAAICKGGFGSPFFVLDGQPFWGSDRMEAIRAHCGA